MGRLPIVTPVVRLCRRAERRRRSWSLRRSSRSSPATAAAAPVGWSPRSSARWRWPRPSAPPTSRRPIRTTSRCGGRSRAAGRRRADRDVGGRVGRAGTRPRRRTHPADGHRPTARPCADEHARGAAQLPVRVPHDRARRSGPRRRRLAAFDGRSRSPTAASCTMSVVPREPGLSRHASCCPPGVTPARAACPASSRLGRWTATFVAVPPEGIAWEASFRGVPPSGVAGCPRSPITSARLPGRLRLAERCPPGCRRTPRSGRRTPPGCSAAVRPGALRRSRRYGNLRNGYGDRNGRSA